MRKYFINLAVVSLALAAASCDDGRIDPDETDVTVNDGRVAKVTGTISGLHSWPSGYDVVVAAFDNESDYALVTKNIPDGAENMGVTLEAIPAEATSIELCVTNRLRRRVVTLQSATINDAADVRDTIMINANNVNAGMFAALQANVFTPRCATCHGGGSTAAGEIHLTADKAYAAIVGQPSHKIEGRNIVVAGNSGESLLCEMLNTDITATWGYDHHKADLSDEWKELITKWIDNGAPE